MKRKPGWLSLILLIFVLTTGIPSCSCGGADYVAIRDIREVIVFDQMLNKKIDANTPTVSDQLAILIFSEIQYFSLLQFHVSGTMSEAWACDPAPPLMVNEITDINVFCDQHFNGEPPNTNLADILQFGPDNTLQLSKTQFLGTLPKINDFLEGFDFGQFQIFLNQKPSPGVYTFTIEMQDNNGNTFTGTTIPINWM